MQPGSGTIEPRNFDFARDTFAFENMTFWDYHFDSAPGTPRFTRRLPKPDYGHRCFVLTRAARQFFFHTRFDPGQPPPDDATCRGLIRDVMRRNPRERCSPRNMIVIPGYANLREFSTARESLLKASCGGAWQSYVLRSHWRMVFPISRAHQAATAASLRAHLAEHTPPVVHLVNFPSLTINHSFLLFAAMATAGGSEFHGYDPNRPANPIRLLFEQRTETFTLPPNHYWAGGKLDVIEIYRSWWM